MPLEKFIQSGRFKNREAAKRAYRAYMAKKHASKKMRRKANNGKRS